MCFFSVYNKLKLKKWQRLSTNKKLGVLNKLEKKEAKKLKISPVKIVLHKDKFWDCYGMYQYTKNSEKLILNPKLLEVDNLRFHAFETIVHETRHAYQHLMATSSPIYWWNFRKKQWARNYGAYITSAEDSAFYNLQPIERDAQKYAIARLSKHSFRFRKEQDFFDTLDRIIDRFENSEEKAKSKHGLFYRFKLRKSLRQKAEKNN